MPSRAKRGCRKAGCSALVDSGFCEAHRDAAQLQQSRWRGSAHSRGYGRAHKKIRAQTMRRDSYLCQRCLEQGRVTPAADSHHIIKKTTRPDLHLDPNNRLSLCRECHEIEEKTAQ